MTSISLGIDPRLRARRIAVLRAEGRRRLRVLSIAVIAVGLAVGSWAVSRSALLDLDHVRIEGLSPEVAAGIEDGLGISYGTPLFDLDLGAIEAQIEALPWVESVAASRTWPGTLSIDVVERLAVAAIPTADGTFVLIDAEGVSTEIVRADEVGLLPVVAVQAVGDLGAVQSSTLPAIDVVRAMPTDLGPWVNAIMVGAGDVGPRLSLDLAGGAVVELGAPTMLADKLDALRAVLAGTDLRCVALIDVRVADLTTIERDPACDAALIAMDAADTEVAA